MARYNRNEDIKTALWLILILREIMLVTYCSLKFGPLEVIEIKRIIKRLAASNTCCIKVISAVAMCSDGSVCKALPMCHVECYPD